MDYNRQQRDQYGQQSGWGQQGRQQDQWRDGGDMDTNYNMQNASAQQPSYGEMYHGNLKQREEETNRARGHNYGHQGGQFQGGMFQGSSQRYGQDYNPGGYGQVGNTGGGYSAWDSHGSSGHDMGRGQGDYGRSNMGYGQQGGYGNMSGGMGYMGRQGGSGQSMHRGSSQYMGDSDQYNRNRRHDDDNDNNWWDRAKSEVRSWFSDDDDNRRDHRNYSTHEGAMYGSRRMVSGERDSDVRSRGEHWGKGPKGYQRSEDRIREDVCERLAYDGYVDASDIDIKVEGHEVILTGTVRSRAEKRRAEDLVESIMGVQNVENRIRVQDQHSGSSMLGGNRSHDDSSRTYGSTPGDSSRSGMSDSSRSTDSDRYSATSGSTSGSGLENRSYTGNSGDQSGIGNESGTTNEIIRNSGKTDTKL